MIVTIIALIITYIVNPDPQVINEGINSKASNELNEAAGLNKVWAFVAINGFRVPLQMFILALVPIQFLYFIIIVSTASLPGILFGLILQIDIKTAFELVISFLPYYTFEIFAFCLFAAILYELNQVIRIKIKNLFKKDKKEVFLLRKTLETVSIYVVLTLPLIVIAAFLETYIADFILGLF